MHPQTQSFFRQHIGHNKINAQGHLFIIKYLSGFIFPKRPKKSSFEAFLNQFMC